MDQIKIGKFICDTRKEIGMTQLELAQKIGVTDRAVSKWENGRGLPDISLIKPLCDALSITINELFNGEKIEEEITTKIAEENIIDTLNYSHKKIMNTKKIFMSILLAVIIFITAFLLVFFIDVNRMINDKPIFFSTWGIDYFPPEDLKDEKLQLAIKEYLVKHGDNEEKHQEGVKTFVASHTYLIEETTTQYNIYAWVLQEQCYVDGNDVMNYGSFSMPYKFTIEEINEDYVVVESRFPRDGTYYEEDMNNLFPKDVKKQMDHIHRDGTFERLQLQIEEQVSLFFHDIYSKY